MDVIRGAEALVKIQNNLVIKKRLPKNYRIPEIDHDIRKKRTKTEARIISMARRFGVPTPIIYDVTEDTIIMERIKGRLLRDIMSPKYSQIMGKCTAILHNNSIIHGDLTPRNVIVKNDRLYFIDFGLAFFDERVEPMGMDIHVYFEAIKADFDNYVELREAFIEGYRIMSRFNEVMERLEDIEARGRYRV
jgi:TP53 regulating kinase-like protein